MEIVVQYSKIAALTVALSSTALAADQDLGTLGPTWEIGEPDMRLAIVAEAHGVDWDSVHEHLAGQAQTHTNDIPDWYVPVAEHTETHFVDPSRRHRSAEAATGRHLSVGHHLRGRHQG